MGPEYGSSDTYPQVATQLKKIIVMGDPPGDSLNAHVSISAHGTRTL